MNIGAYDLIIDDYREQRQITNQEEWSSVVQRGTTIVMRVVMVQQTDEKKYKCPFCESWKKIVMGSAGLTGGALTLPFNYHGFLMKAYTVVPASDISRSQRTT